MKYLAMLKDSFRETLDSKVLLVLIGLSLVLTLLIASISFQPVPANEAFGTIASQFGVVYADRGRSALAKGFFFVTTVRDLKVLNAATEPQRGDYEFTLSVSEFGRQHKAFLKAVAYWSRPFDMESLLADEAPAEPPPDALLGEFIKSQFELFGNVQVTEVTRLKAGGAKESYEFRVRTRGTGAERGWLHDPALFFGALPMSIFRTSIGRSVFWIEDSLVAGIGARVAVLIAIIITAFFIPNMLRKGTVDLLVSKPIHRVTLLVYKYVGGLTFVFLASAVTVVGIWLALGLRSGIWAPGFLLTVFILTFSFAILYSVSALFGVLTRSAVVAILMTCLASFLLWLVGLIHTQLGVVRGEPGLANSVPQWAYNTVDVCHAVLPRTKDLDNLTSVLLSREVMTEAEIRRNKLDRLPSVNWAESVGVSLAFIAVMLGLASWRFATKDY
jgi:ABC-type transport system involved in multi-copper enzyme maturation permease subunit